MLLLTPQLSEITIMRTTLALDDDLLEKAQAFTGPMDKTALVREALKALIQRESAQRLALLGGSEPLLVDIPRRQSEPA
jgi:Arc/MetJ family transcription regulator